MPLVVFDGVDVYLFGKFELAPAPEDIDVASVLEAEAVGSSHAHRWQFLPHIYLNPTILSIML